MDRVQAANDGASVHHRVAVLHAPPLARRLVYPLVAAPVMGVWAGLLDGPWSAGFAYAVLLVGVASTWRAMLPPRLLERVRPHEGRAVVSDAGNHHVVASPNLMAWCGYLILAVPVMGSWYGLADTPDAALVAYALLLLGVPSIWRAMLPRQRMERVREEQGNHHEVVPTPEAVMAWFGYVLMAASMLWSSFGLADTPAAALVAYSILLLGFAFIGIAMVPLRPMERILQEENRAVRNANRRQGDEVVVPRARGMDWTGYIFVAAPMLAGCGGLVDGLAEIFFAYALLLLGVAFIIIAMLALAKSNMA